MTIHFKNKTDNLKVPNYLEKKNQVHPMSSSLAQLNMINDIYNWIIKRFAELFLQGT